MGSKRANGEGTVRKRKDGRWEGFITVGHKENGKPIYKSVFAKTQKELMPKLRNLIDEYLKKKKTLKYCPHGRPIVFTLTEKAIEKQFKRIVG